MPFRKGLHRVDAEAIPFADTATRNASTDTRWKIGDWTLVGTPTSYILYMYSGTDQTVAGITTDSDWTSAGSGGEDEAILPPLWTDIDHDALSIVRWTDNNLYYNPNAITESSTTTTTFIETGLTPSDSVVTINADGSTWDLSVTVTGTIPDLADSNINLVTVENSGILQQLNQTSGTVVSNVIILNYPTQSSATTDKATIDSPAARNIRVNYTLTVTRRPPTVDFNIWTELSPAAGGPQGFQGIGISGVTAPANPAAGSTQIVTVALNDPSGNTTPANQTFQVAAGAQGEQGIPGVGSQGVQGDQGIGIFTVTGPTNPAAGANTTITVNLSDPSGDTTPIAQTFIVPPGSVGAAGNGIQSVTLTSTVGLVKTYQILFTDSNTFDFTVTDGTSIQAFSDTAVANQYISEIDVDSGGNISLTRETLPEVETIIPEWTDRAFETNELTRFGGILYYANHAITLTNPPNSTFSDNMIPPADSFVMNNVDRITLTTTPSGGDLTNDEIVSVTTTLTDGTVSAVNYVSARVEGNFLFLEFVDTSASIDFDLNTINMTQNITIIYNRGRVPNMNPSIDTTLWTALGGAAAPRTGADLYTDETAGAYIPVDVTTTATGFETGALSFGPTPNYMLFRSDGTGLVYSSDLNDPTGDNIIHPLTF